MDNRRVTKCYRKKRGKKRQTKMENALIGGMWKENLGKRKIRGKKSKKSKETRSRGRRGGRKEKTE